MGLQLPDEVFLDIERGGRWTHEDKTQRGHMKARQGLQLPKYQPQNISGTRAIPTHKERCGTGFLVETVGATPTVSLFRLLRGPGFL